MWLKATDSNIEHKNYSLINLFKYIKEIVVVVEPNRFPWTRLLCAVESNRYPVDKPVDQCADRAGVNREKSTTVFRSVDKSEMSSFLCTGLSTGD